MTLFLAVGAVLLSGASPAFGHAVLLSANPSPNVGLSKPPERITLRMSEPLRVPPSTIRVLDSNGKNLARSVRRLSGDPQSMQASLAALERGVYRVEWRSVSVLDGHTIRGSYLFGVGEPPPGSPAAAESGPLAGPGIPGILLRIAQDGALLLLLGTAALALLAGSAAPRFTSVATRSLPTLSLVAFAATAATTVAEASTAAGWAPSAWGSFLTGSVAAWGRTIVLALTAAAPVAAFAGTPLVVAIAATGALAAVGISGHAGATTHPAAFMAANAVHLVFAGVWLGGVAAIAVVWRRLRPEKEEIVGLIARVSPYAIGSALVVGATGAANAIGQLSSFSDLWTSGYGRVVLGKTAALGAAAAFGLRHSFVLRPRLAAGPSNPGYVPIALGIRRALRGEAITALVAVVLAAVLVAFPDPPAAAKRAERQEKTVAAIYAVGDRPFATVADRDDDVVVSLTVAPPEPGPVMLAVQLIPSGEVSTDGWRVGVESTSPSGAATSTSLRPCGPGCFLGSAVLAARGNWRFAVTAEDKHVQFELSLPAPDGRDVLGRLRTAWNALRSIEIDEAFRGPGGFALDTEYRYAGPDRFSRTDNTGRREIDIGARRYERTGSGPWQSGDNPFPITAPFPFIWQQAPEQPRLLGDTMIQNRPAYVLALFDPFGIWYRVAIDKQTFLPLEDRMRAIGHFMDRTFSRFNQDMAIEAPI